MSMQPLNPEVLQLTTHPITATGLTRVLLSHFEYEEYHSKRQNVSFKLAYKINKKQIESQWKFKLFDHSYLCYLPKRHINIKLPLDLFEYEIQLRISMLFTDEFHNEIGGETVRKNIWLPWSNTITTKVNSSMTISLRVFKLNSFVKWQSNDPRYTHNFGTIIEITKKSKNESNYKIIDYLGNTHNISDYNETETRWEDRKMNSIVNWKFIDLSNRMEADKCLLVGDRENVGKNDVDMLFELLVNIFYNEYAMKYAESDFFSNALTNDWRSQRIKNQTVRSMGICIALEVINCLYCRKYNSVYKIECPFVEIKEKFIHKQKRLQLISFRKELIDRKWMFGEMHCDSCLCGPGVYDFMYHCKRNDFIPHDLCVSCIYDIIKQYQQLSQLLFGLLSMDLTNDCIQTVAVFVVGNIVK